MYLINLVKITSITTCVKTCADYSLCLYDRSQPAYNHAILHRCNKLLDIHGDTLKVVKSRCTNTLVTLSTLG